ncbi:bro [Spodoptera frugiperda granulovirus]|uniref:Bro n=1 Tax=Spodoptera frugiperda granulovirus TaxID=307454 RepID=A0A0C5AUU9_9BBAC|nr:bro [Spodoptera frugiperda granulovirus]AJK91713.1 bro [Spodoptera frugiperda granulovirus]
MLTQQTFSVGGKKCELWIVKLDNNVFMYSGKDVAKILSYVNTNDALIKHVLPQWKKTWEKLERRYITLQRVIVPFNWQPHKVFITEAGVYALIVRSKRPEAIKFKQWLFEKVIPELRQKSESYNAYEATPVTPPLYHVYIATSENYERLSVYKIGTTSNLTKRLNQLNCSRAFNLLYYLYTVPVGCDGVAIEAELHKLYDEVRIRGEFFRLNKKQLKDAVEFLLAKSDTTTNTTTTNFDGVSTILATIDNNV